ncbi:MAG: sensor histidine kinase [Methylotenera sp.]|jgi:signal transduction histidine kinase|nr:sensor histidine kinase [Methylotenera sp.]
MQIKFWRLKPLSVKKLLLVSFLLTALLPMLVVTVLAFYQARTVLREEISRDMQTRANAALSEIDNMMFERLQNVVSWSRLEVMQEVAIHDIDKRLSNFLNELQVSYRGVYQALYVANMQNIVVASSDPSQIGQPVTQNSPWMQINFANHPVTLASLAQQRLPIASEIKDVNQQAIGTLWVVFDWKYIENILNNTSNQGSAAALLDESAPSERVLAQTKDWQKITAAHDISERSKVSNMATAPIFHWGVTITQYRSVVMAPVHRMGFIFLFFLAVTAMLATILATPLARNITRPLARLTRYAHGFVRTSQAALPPADGPSEVRALTGAFGQMIEDLTLSKENLTRAAKLAVAGEMAAAMSHEIRTPLGILRSSAQVLAREKNLSAEGQEVAVFISTETERLNKLVSTLVDSARPRPPEFLPHDMVLLLEHAVAMLRMQANKKDISLSFEVYPLQENISKQIIVECDNEQITQVILNLLLNAIQVLPEGGTLAVTLYEAIDDVMISVADNGSGVSEAQKAQIFDPFFTQRPGGIGLGLAVSKQIVTTHFGTLTVETSTLAETGADFRVKLPKQQLHT